MENIERMINSDEVISIKDPDDNVLLSHHTYSATT